MNTLRRHARIGIIHFMAFPEVMTGSGPVAETLRTIVFDDYFDAVEVTCVNDPSEAREVAVLLTSSQISVSFGAHPVILGNKLNLNSLDRVQRNLAVEGVRRCFDQAVLFGARSLTVLAGPWSQGMEGECEAALIESLVRLSKEAASHGMQLALEVFDDAVEKKVYVGKWPVAKRVGEAVRAECENFGLIHDLSHLPILQETAEEALHQLKHLLVQTHIGNALLSDSTHPCYGDKHPRFGLPGSENNVQEVADFLETLYEIDFLGGTERRVVAFEVRPMPDEDPRVVIANAKRTLNEAAILLHRLSPAIFENSPSDFAFTR